MRGALVGVVLAVAVPAVSWAQDGGLVLPVDVGDAGVATSAEVAQPPSPPPPTFVEQWFHGSGVYSRTAHYEVGLMLGQGGLLFADGVAPIPLNAVMIRERNGLISYLMTVLAGQALSSWAIASSAVEVSNVRTSQSSNVNYNADGSKTLVTTTTTTADVRQLKSQEQVDRETEASNKSISTGFVGHTFGELAIYAELPGLTQPGRPAGQGYEMTFGGHGELFTLLDLPAVLDLGFHLANVRVTRPVSPGLGGEFLYHAAGGILARLHVPLTRFATFSVEWILNFLSFDFVFEREDALREGRQPLSPLRFSLDLHATDHVFVRGEATFGTLGIADGRLGIAIAAGVRL